MFCRSIVPFWEELLVFNEDFEYILQGSPPVLILFEVLDFVNFTVASSQYRKLGKYILLQVVAFQNKSLPIMKIMDCFSEFLLAIPFCLSLMFNKNYRTVQKEHLLKPYFSKACDSKDSNTDFVTITSIFIPMFLKVTMFSEFILKA